MSLKAKIEAVIYASEEPVTLAQLTGLLAGEAQAELDASATNQTSLPMEDEDQASSSDAEPGEAGTDDKAQSVAQKLKARNLRDHFRRLLDQLIAEYAEGDRGLEIREVAGGFRLATKPEYHDAVRGFIKQLKPPLKLTLQALETLAVVAYKQPVTSPEVSEIRGVESAGTLGSLIARKLITTAGRKQVIGRPILYKTTKDFLVRFGLKDISELPSIEEFEKLAGELNETLLDETSEPEAEEVAMEDPEREAGRESTEDASAGTPTSVAETESAPEPTHIFHDTPEDLLSDKSSQPEGHKHEPEAHVLPIGPSS